MYYLTNKTYEDLHIYFKNVIINENHNGANPKKEGNEHLSNESNNESKGVYIIGFIFIMIIILSIILGNY